MNKLLERLFVRLTEFYPEFNGQPDDWLNAIEGLEPLEIKSGLDKLKDRPYCPTPHQFRDLCLDARKEAIKKIQDLPGLAPSGFPGHGQGKAWAKKILDRHEAGEPIQAIVLTFARQALGY